jgi:hypothetical protein
MDAQEDSAAPLGCLAVETREHAWGGTHASYELRRTKVAQIVLILTPAIQILVLGFSSA